MDTRYVSGVGRETFELCTTIIGNEVPSYEITLSNRCSLFFFFFLFFYHFDAISPVRLFLTTFPLQS